MIETIRINVSDTSDIGYARRRAIDFCNTLMLPFSEEDIGNVALLVTELATNIKKHAESGQIIMHPIYFGDKTGLQLFAVDHGPGFPDGTNFLQDGTSTAGTLGIGLGGIQRISKNFDFITIPGLGVILACQYWPPHLWKEDLFGQIEIGGINVPIQNEELSGDCWTIEPLGNRYRVFLADGLGHGKAASEAAVTAVTLFRKNKTMRLEDLVHIIHQGLKSTRGVVLSILEIDQDREKLLHIGVGNINTRLINSETQKTLLSSNGTAGVNIYKTYINEININKDTIAIIHSDGINEHWNQKDVLNLWKHHPAAISGWLYHQYGRPRDDASCVVIKIHDRGQV